MVLIVYQPGTFFIVKRPLVDVDMVLHSGVYIDVIVIFGVVKDVFVNHNLLSWISLRHLFTVKRHLSVKSLSFGLDFIQENTVDTIPYFLYGTCYVICIITRWIR